MMPLWRAACSMIVGEPRNEDEEVDAASRRYGFARGHHAQSPTVANCGRKIGSAYTTCHGGELHGMIAADKFGESGRQRLSSRGTTLATSWSAT